jgi:hypothetical protein
VLSALAVMTASVPGGTYQVTKRLPENQGEFEYCIKNLEEPYARVVRRNISFLPQILGIVPMTVPRGNN